MPASDTDALATYDLGQCSLLYRRRSFDKLVIREIWKWDEYFLQRLPRPTRAAIVDVGAHIGAFALKAQQSFPESRVFALEPVSENFELLERNLARNACSSVTALNVAVAAASGWVDVYLSPNNTAGHSTVLKHPGRRQVRALSLSDLFREHELDDVYLLKLDCEGAEYEILATASFGELAAKVSNLVLEYHPVDGQSFQELKPSLEERGFVMTAHKSGYLPGQGTALFQRSGA